MTHTISRSHKQLGNRAPGTAITVSCSSCGTFGQIVYHWSDDVRATYTNRHGYDTEHQVQDGRQAFDWLTKCHNTSTNQPAESTAVDAQEPLPWDVLAEQIAASYVARLVPEIMRACADLTGKEKDLTTIHVLNAIATEARRLTTSRVRNAVYAGLPQNQIAGALGISRQAVNQNYVKRGA